jgi:hypothetical protein
MSEPPERVQTRAKNVNQHPGLVVPKRKRRTQAEIRDDNEREKKERDEVQQQKEKQMRKLASLEDALKEKDLKANAGQAVKMTMRPRMREVSFFFPYWIPCTYVYSIQLSTSRTQKTMNLEIGLSLRKTTASKR